LSSRGEPIQCLQQSSHATPGRCARIGKNKNYINFENLKPRNKISTGFCIPPQDCSARGFYIIIDTTSQLLYNYRLNSIPRLFLVKKSLLKFYCANTQIRQPTTDAPPS
jgi:hypothetical protein